MLYPEQFSDKLFRVQNWGTFDLQNYGDLLFPLILETELKKRIPEIQLTLHSPYGNWFPPQPTRWVNRIYRLEDNGFFSQVANCQGIILGGGDLLRFDDTALAFIYGISNEQAEQERSYRIFIEDLGQLASWVPVIWNAVGIPFEFSEQQTIVLRKNLQNVSYISVRDELSRKKLVNLGINNQVHVVPDTAFLVARYHPKINLTDVRATLIQTGQFPETGKVLCFQISQGAAPYEKELVRALRKLLDKDTELQIVLLPIGLYTDVPILKSIQEQIGIRTFLVNGTTDTRVVASVIAHSDYFAGSSLHGNITAYAYGIPHLFIDFLNLAKVRGVAALMGSEKQIVTQESMLALSLFSLVQQQKDWDRPITQIIAQIDNHFDCCAEILQGQVVEKMLPSSVALQSVEQSSETLRFVLKEKEAKLERVQAELERSQAQAQHTQAELERSQAQVQHTQAELERSQATITSMQTSKFWKLRTKWFTLKNRTKRSNLIEKMSRLVKQLRINLFCFEKEQYDR